MPLNNLTKPSSLTIILKVYVIVKLGFICILTLSVSNIYPEQQLAIPEMVPQVKSTIKFNISLPLLKYKTISFNLNCNNIKILR